MKALVLALAVPLLAAVPQYRIDLSRYFATPASEAASRRRTIADAHAFLRSTTSSVGTPLRLTAWLDAFNRLSKQLERHDLYVYVRAEENTEDTSDAQADEALGSLEDLTGAHADEVIASLGRERARRFVDAYAPLARYRYFIESAIARSAHDPGFAVNRAIAQLADPTINAMGASYKVLRKKTLAEAATATHAGATAAMAKHDAFAKHEESFATMLIAIASARNGTARLRRFSGAAEASYFSESLTPQSVTRTLNAVRAADSYRRYDAVVAAAPAKRFVPAAIPIEKAIPLILAAERPMGAVYASAYERLFDPAQRRLDICTDPACDGSGFSIGFAGFESGLFFGGYTGSVNSARAVAHEAGHAVHRQFMNEHQAVAVYNDGPKWMFESFAIFNELLFYDHLYKSATDPAERAYYLDTFIDDATFQIFGSAEEADLEASIYQAVASGTARSAADFDALNQRVFARYEPRSRVDVDTTDYWARDSLYFTDPLYDVNYLYAGLLALRYFTAFEHDPGAFSKNYVALLQNGFTQPPAALERKFLNIDLEDESGLVRNANDFINARTLVLSRLYATAAK